LVFGRGWDVAHERLDELLLGGELDREVVATLEAYRRYRVR